MMLNRRRFLLGLGGVTLGLPLLESFPERLAQGQSRPTTGFVIIYRQANGVQQAITHWATMVNEPENFWPHTLGPLTAASVQGRAVDELGAHLSKLLIVSGVAMATPGISCAHTSSCNRILSAAQVEKYGGMNETHALGPSIDNLLASQLNGEGRGPLYVETSQPNAWSVAGMSYVGARMRRNPDFNPLVVYNRMMGMPPPTDVAAEQLLMQRRSVNDLVRERMQWLLSRPQLSAEDRRRLEIHQQNIRDAEMHMAMSCALPAADAATFQTSAQHDWGNNGDGLWDDHPRAHALARLHIDVSVLALSCGYNKVNLISMGGYNSMVNYAMDGLPNGKLGFHKISHRATTDGDPATDPTAMRLPDAWQFHHQIDRLHLQDFNYLLDKLTATSDANGPLIDQGVAVYLSDLAAGSHSEENLPFVLAGNANGYLRTGQYIDARESGQYVKHNRMLNTLINATGVRKPDGSPWTDFGDTGLPGGQIPGMLASG